ncbi:MAG: acetate--CoA ligase family protein [Rubrivivax sp.]
MTHSLDALFRPRSVAVVGASSDPNKVGGRPLAFLKKGGFPGRVLPVNPAAREVQGLPAYPTLDAIDGPIDQVIIAVPAAAVLQVIDDCAARGVKAVQIFSAGFGEGADAAALRARVRDKAREAGLRVLGPNSLGLFNAVDGFFGTFATALDGAWPKAGGIGVATQSGAFGSYFFGMAQQRGLGFSHFVATGNEWDVDVADCIAWLAADSSTRLIVTAMEGCCDGRKLAAALMAARAAGKRVLAMKVGVSEAGARAAATHTGSLSGADRVFSAVLRDTGAVRLGSLQALVDAAYVATVGPLPQGRRLLVVTTSGGIGVLAADAAEASGLELPAVPEEAAARIRDIAPLADGRNPVDTSAGILSDLSAYARIAQQAIAAAPFDAVLCYVAHVARNPAHWAQLREPLLALRERHPALTFVAVGLADAAVVADFEAHHVPVFTDPTQAVTAIAACAPRPAAGLQMPPASLPAKVIDEAIDSEALAKTALARHGIAFAPERLVADEDAAAAAAAEIGWPVVLKVVSPDIAHKTEAGGVALDLRDEQQLRHEVAAMRHRVRQRRPGARIDGFLVAPQLTGGIEVLLGTQNDPVFGPVVTVGAGGVLTELLADVCVRLAPVSLDEALEMLRSTRLARLLDGWRGAARADVEALARQVVALSEVAWANRDRIDGIDLNPVLALPDGACAVDALIVRKGAPQ